MTDRELVEKKLAHIETCLAELRANLGPGDVTRDLKSRRFAEHTLQIAIQAAVDVASHICSDDRLGEPATNRALFDLLARAGWLPDAQVETLRRMVGFRNILVHGYEAVDPAIVQELVDRRLGDLQAFVDAIRARWRAR